MIIIDNASTDGTEEMIEVEFQQPEIIYENTGSNLGGAGGFEYGVGKAIRMGYEYVWIMVTIPCRRKQRWQTVRRRPKAQANGASFPALRTGRMEAFAK